MPLLFVPRKEVVGELDGSNRKIDGWSIATLVVFLLVNILVIFPLRIPLPFFVSRACRKLLVLVGLKQGTALEPGKVPPSPPSPEPAASSDSPPDSSQTVEGSRPLSGKLQIKLAQPAPKRWHFTIGLNTAPVIGVLLLLATTCIPGSVVRSGIVGSSHGVRPYDVMTLFICFAYISVSLDSTGLLRYIAFLVASRASSSGRLLFNVFYVFWTVVGLIVGNDPLILSGTPFLSYFTSHANIKAPGTEAFLYPHFQVSNLVSALLVSSNPTNLVLTSAFGISFLSYSAWLALPTVAAVIFMYPLLRYFLFRASIPPNISPPKIDARTALRDPWGGIFGAALFLVTIVLLVGLSAGGKLESVQGVWTVTAPAALIMLGRDILHDLRSTNKQKKQERSKGSLKETEKPVEVGNPSADSERATPVDGSPAKQQPDQPRSSSEDHPNPSPEDRPKPSPVGRDDSGAEDGDAPPDRPVSPISGTSTPLRRVASGPTGPPLLRPLTSRLPTVSGTISRLPLPLLPFAFSMFILVEALQHTGWIRVFGRWWAAWADVGGVAGSVFMMGVISVIGCNIFGTNIGATIMLSRILQQWQATNGPVSDRKLYGAVFAVAVGSNFGAYSFVFSASLAGLLWRSILGQKGITIRQLDFIRYNWLPLVVTMIVGLLVVGGEVCVMFKT